MKYKLLMTAARLLLLAAALKIPMPPLDFIDGV
jgi:hypothetical protein